MAKVSRQSAVRRLLDEELDEPIATPYGAGGGQPGDLSERAGPMGDAYRQGRVQTTRGQTSQLPSNAGAYADLAGQTGVGVAQSLAGAGTGAALGGITLGTNYLGDKLKPREELPTYGGTHGAITDQYGRRFEGAGPGVAGGAVKGAGYGAMFGGAGAGVGALAGAIYGAATKNAPSAFSDFSREDAADAVTRAFQDYRGIPPAAGEVDEILAGQGLKPGDRWVGEKGLFAVLDALKANGEAERAAQTSQTSPAVGTGAGGAQSAVASLLGAAGGGGQGIMNAREQINLNPETGQYETTPGGIASADGAVPRGTLPPGLGQYAYKLEGFGGTRDGGSKFEDANASPKYQIGRVLSHFPPTPEGLQAALPELNALGIGTFTIGGSKGDKLSVGGAVDPRFEGVTEFDVIRAAGKGGEAWQFAPPGGGGAASAAGSTAGGARQTPVTAFGSGSLEQILAALGQIAQGENQPVTLQNALIRQLMEAA